ncbi:MAG TPA: TonB-dependent receptor [Candidatus Acidoferrales bacterium]|nr:TonB-dependent receptor [Candidatus Acidoferrales bacterium]
MTQWPVMRVAIRSTWNILLVFVFLSCSGVCAQTNTGELRLKITDPSGLGLKTKIEISSSANEYRSTLATDDTGNAIAKNLPYGVYRITVRQPGFATASQTVEIRSALPQNYTIKLKLLSVTTSVKVSGDNTLIDPDRAGSVYQIGSATIQNRLSSLPGRSLQDLVNSQPGWLYEGNAVLHPRGSEYDTQFVVDGIPLMDNRSPSFGPEIEADDVESMSIYTAGFPAEYGRKLGGVVEINTQQSTQAGFHGQAVLSGGSFDTAGAFVQAQDVWGKNTLGFSTDGNTSGHYLNPVVPQNFTNTGTTGDFSADYERDFTPSDRLNLSVRHEFSRYLVPNEQLQQAAGQRQNGDNFETMGVVAYQHTFSSDVVGDLRGMVRENSNDLYSNPLSTPIIAFQHNWFREGYFKGDVSVHHGAHEWRIGIESDNVFLHENFTSTITDPSRFDPGTPLTFNFPGPSNLSAGNRPDLEQSAFAQDLIRLGHWTISAGLRWDHYQLLVNQNAVSPRLSVARYFPSADLVLHASYDRAFQTPSWDNILLSSSPAVLSLNPNVLRLPVEPSRANYYEGGLTKAFFGKFKLDANYFRRLLNNFADDDQLLNTGVSFPIAFRKAIIYGAEARLDLPQWRGLSGFASYSYTVGNAWFPVVGGLFLGQDAINGTTQLSGHFPDSQDQRNTIRFRTRYDVTPRFWIAGGAQYGSGLPFDFNGTQALALSEYGQMVVDRVNFDRGRVRPSLSIDLSLGAEIYKSDFLAMRTQFDVENLNNRLNVIDFGGLFSGNAIGPPRSYSVRLTASF